MSRHSRTARWIATCMVAGLLGAAPLGASQAQPLPVDSGTSAVAPVKAPSVARGGAPGRCAWSWDHYQMDGDFPKVCAALRRGKLHRLIQMCRGCSAAAVAKALPKWRKASYRRKMLAVLRSGNFGADAFVFPGFAYSMFQDAKEASVWDSYQAVDRVRASRILGVGFPTPIPDGWRPDYHGPVLIFMYDPYADKPSYRFWGAYEFGRTNRDGSWCTSMTVRCA